MDFRPLIFVLLAVGALAWYLLRGEIELTDENVTALIDDNDQNFRSGNSYAICAQRARDFTLYATTYNLMSYQGPSSYSEIESREATFGQSRDSSYTRNNSYTRTSSRSEFCETLKNQADELRETYRRRTNLTITVELDDQHARYEAEYVFVSPLPEGHEYPKGATGDIYVYSRMSETGTVELEEHKPVFKSARSRLRNYWLYPANIPVIDRPPVN